MSTFLKLEHFFATKPDEEAATRANAVFIYAKLCQAGVAQEMAKEAVEKLFTDGRREGVRQGVYDHFIANR